MDRPDRSPAPTSSAALGRRQLLRGVALAGAGGLMAACSSPGSRSQPVAPGRPKRGGALKAALTGGGPTDTVDPHKGVTYLDTARLQSLYSPLVQLDANANLEYMLAESITPTRSNDFTEWEIKLRPGVTFHNGKSLTAQDVIYTLNRIVSNGFSGTNPLGPVDIKNTKAADPLTVLVKMTSRSAAS